jgi:hypothetical protein
MLPCVLVSKDRCTSGVQPFVAVGVVEVPVRVDEVLDGIGGNRCKRVDDLWTRTGKAGVDEELTVATGMNGNISASAHQDAYVAAEFLDSDRASCCCFPRCLHEPVMLSEQMAWSEQTNSGSQTGGPEKAAA